MSENEGSVKHIDPEEIGKFVKNDNTVLVDFWAPWCGPCRAFGPIFEQAAERYPEAVFAKVNIDEYPEFAMKNAIQSIPTLWVFKNGEKVYNKPGSLNHAQVESLMNI